MIRGQVVLKLGDDVSTDIIYPGRFMATVLPTETPHFAFADHVEFNHRLEAGEVPAGSVIAAGTNFGCGSSREQAASCLRGHQLTVIARSFARIFLQNGINLGLSMVICPTLEAEDGDQIEVLGERVFDRTSNRSFPISPLPKARQAIIDAGGLIPYTRALLIEEEVGQGRRG
jgi:3-isopropylmalate/(R)-2-methylmalate dehydratase small subunit